MLLHFRKVVSTRTTFEPSEYCSSTSNLYFLKYETRGFYIFSSSWIILFADLSSQSYKPHLSGRKRAQLLKKYICNLHNISVERSHETSIKVFDVKCPKRTFSSFKLGKQRYLVDVCSRYLVTGITSLQDD